MGTSFTPCKKPLDEGLAETQAKTRLSSCHVPEPYSSCTALLLGLYTNAYARVLFNLFLPLYLVGTRQVSQWRKNAWAFWKLRRAFLHWAFHSSKRPHSSSVFTIVVSFGYCCQLSIVVSFGYCLSIEYCCWFWLLLSIESRRWFWLLLSNFWPNPKVNSWVLLTFTMDNFTIIDNMNRTTWLWKL